MEIDKPGLLKVVSPHLEIRSVSTGVRQAKLNLAGSSSSSNVTYCDVSRVPSSNSLVIDVVDHTTKEKNIRIYVPLSVERQLKRRGWDALMVQQQRGIRSRRRVCAYRLFDEGRQTIVILRIPDTSNFMGSIRDETPLGDLTIPGTHESCALYGYPISQCQQPSTPIWQQLMDGIRYFDVRLRVVGDDLLMYHGPRPQRSSLSILLSTFHQFLEEHPTETFILCLKEETPPNHPQFSYLVYQTFRPFLTRWYLENRIPRLGEVRGKGILMTRFDRKEKEWEDGLGIHPYTWPDSRKEGFEWNCAGTRFRIQDWYRVKTFLEIPEKFQAVVDHLTPTLDPVLGSPFTLSCTSAASLPLSLPTTIAKGFGWPSWGLGIYGMNDRMIGWLLKQVAGGKRVRGCILIDFYRQSSNENHLSEILVAMNNL